MLPLCADQGVGTIPWSPLARGRLARANDAVTDRSSSNDAAYADMLYTQEASDHAIIEAVGVVASRHGVSKAQVALAWLRANPVVSAPLVGATKPSQIDDAVASIDLKLTTEEIESLEAPYTPRYDLQGISDEAELARISKEMGIAPA